MPALLPNGFKRSMSSASTRLGSGEKLPYPSTHCPSSQRLSAFIEVDHFVFASRAPEATTPELRSVISKIVGFKSGGEDYFVDYEISESAAPHRQASRASATVRELCHDAMTPAFVLNLKRTSYNAICRDEGRFAKTIEPGSLPNAIFTMRLAQTQRIAHQVPRSFHSPMQQGILLRVLIGHVDFISFNNPPSTCRRPCYCLSVVPNKPRFAGVPSATEEK